MLSINARALPVWLQIMGQVRSDVLAYMFGLTLCLAFLAPILKLTDEPIVSVGEFVPIAVAIVVVRNAPQRASDSNTRASDAPRRVDEARPREETPPS